MNLFRYFASIEIGHKWPLYVFGHLLCYQGCSADDISSYSSFASLMARFHTNTQTYSSSRTMHNTMASSNGNIFRTTGHLCGEFTGPRWIPRKGQWREALVFSLICVWINDWVNNREAGDLRCYRAHYDVIVMTFLRCVLKNMDSWSCRFALKNDELRQHLKYVVLTVDHPWGIQNNFVFVFVLLQWMPSWHYVCCSRGSLWQ